LAPSKPTKPYITLATTADVPEHHMGGAAGLVRASLQVDIWGATTKSAHTVREAVRNRLDGHRGTTGDDSLDIRRVSRANGSDDIVPPSDGSEDAIRRRTMDFYVWYAESIPTLGA
jgi:hypothetical protein